jgi:hypothetical protein
VDIIADKRNRWTETEIELLRLNYPYKTTKEFMELLPGRSWDAIEVKANKLKIEKTVKAISSRVWKETEIEILKEYYPSHGRAFVADKLGRSQIDVKKQAEILKIKREGTYQKRTYAVNESFFESPNPLSCFVAGWICTDGNVVKNRFRIELSRVDIEVLNNFKILLRSSHPINLEVKQPNGFVSSYRETAILNINSKKMVSDLALNFGIVPRKTPIQKFPTHLSIENLLCLLIGVIEGDGSLPYACYRPGQNGRRFSFDITACNKVFLDLIQETLNVQYGVTATIQEIKDNKLQRVYYRLKLYNKNALTVCMDLMLLAKKHRIPLLMRKWQKALDYAHYLLANYSVDN